MAGHHPARMKLSGKERSARRVAIANDPPERLHRLAEVVSGLGHDAFVYETNVVDVYDLCERLRPDIVLLGRGSSDEQGLALIAGMTHEGSRPVIASLSALDVEYVREAARHGASGYVVGFDANELEAAMDIAVERFAQYEGLQDAFARRAVVEQAKGILMARNGIGPDAAFDLLRTHARRNSRKIVDVAEAVVESHLLLVPTAAEAQDPSRLIG